MKSKIFICFLLFVSYSVLLPSCKNKSNDPNGKNTIYFDGTDKIQQIFELKKGKLNGLFEEFYLNGKTKRRAFYQNDSIRDTAFYFHENGNPSSIQVFDQGEKTGCWKKFNKAGMLYQEVNFKNDKKEGPSNTYTYISGRPLERLNYKDGDREGKQEYFYDSGKPKSVSWYHENQPCLGLQEWTEGGEKVRNDFKITIEEQNKVMLKNSITYIIRLQNPEPDDQVYETSESDTGNVVTALSPLTHKGDHFVLECQVSRGWFVMRKVKIAAFRKTGKGNIMIKTATINVSANNF